MNGGRFEQVSDHQLGAGGPQGRRPVVLAADHGANREPAIEEQAGHGSPDRPELTGGSGDEDRSAIGHAFALSPSRMRSSRPHALSGAGSAQPVSPAPAISCAADGSGEYGDDEQEEMVVRQDRAHRMKAWGTVLPDCREKGQPDLELKEQRPPDHGQVGLRSGELLPRHHRVTSRYRTRSSTSETP
jgi:hypothetical protein